jgi:hypothetical protein
LVPTLRSFAVRAALDHPEIAHGDSFVTEKFLSGSLLHQLRRETSLIRFEVTPGLHRLNHMRVSIDRSHHYLLRHN